MAPRAAGRCNRARGRLTTDRTGLPPRRWQAATIPTGRRPPRSARPKRVGSRTAVRLGPGRHPTHPRRAGPTRRCELCCRCRLWTRDITVVAGPSAGIAVSQDPRRLTSIADRIEGGPVDSHQDDRPAPRRDRGAAALARGGMAVHRRLVATRAVCGSDAARLQLRILTMARHRDPGRCPHCSAATAPPETDGQPREAAHGALSPRLGLSV